MATGGNLTHLDAGGRVAHAPLEFKPADSPATLGGVREGHDSISVEILPEPGGTWSVCVMDGAGEVIDAKQNLTEVAAAGVAGEWAARYGTRCQIIGGPARTQDN